MLQSWQHTGFLSFATKHNAAVTPGYVFQFLPTFTGMMIVQAWTQWYAICQLYLKFRLLGTGNTQYDRTFIQSGWKFSLCFPRMLYTVWHMVMSDSLFSPGGYRRFSAWLSGAGYEGPPIAACSFNYYCYKMVVLGLADVLSSSLSHSVCSNVSACLSTCLSLSTLPLCLSYRLCAE